MLKQNYMYIEANRSRGVGESTLRRWVDQVPQERVFEITRSYYYARRLRCRAGATVEQLGIPNIVNRAFEVPAPNQVWCGNIICIWAQGKWHYLAVVLDLCTRRVMGWALSEKPDADLAIKALDVAYE